MTRSDALRFVSFAVDDAASQRDIKDMPPNARLVGWQCGFEPLFVAVWSYLPDVRLAAEDAADLATDLLIERNWFADGQPKDPDYVI
jgi:hypothetical protein